MINKFIKYSLKGDDNFLPPVNSVESTVLFSVSPPFMLQKLFENLDCFCIFTNQLENVSQLMLIFKLFQFQSLGNSQKEYEKVVVEFSVKNQLRYKGNLGK